MAGWQDIEAEVLRRIHARDWPPGSSIPNEADLALEFGVARATVNRALQSLAEAGWLDRRRRSGTRVALHPVRRAVFAIPLIRAEVTALGANYAHHLLLREEATAPPEIVAQLGAGPHLHLMALHLANGRVFAHEDRWVNIPAVPAILDADLTATGANEWLVGHAPFTHGDYQVSARQAAELSKHFGCADDAALICVRRGTWNGDQPITLVEQVFAPGHRLKTAI